MWSAFWWILQQKCQKMSTFFVTSWKMAWFQIQKMFSEVKSNLKATFITSILWSEVVFKPKTPKLMIRSCLHKNIWTFWQNFILFTWTRPLIINIEFKRWPLNLILHQKTVFRFQINAFFIYIYGVFFTWRRPLIQKMKFKRWH